MRTGQRSIVTMLAAVVVLLGLNLIVKTAPAAGGQESAGPMQPFPVAIAAHQTIGGGGSGQSTRHVFRLWSDGAVDWTIAELEPGCTTGTNTSVTFTSTSDDPDDDPLTCSWDIMTGTPATSTDCTVTGVTFPNLTGYPVTLTVSDGRGGTDAITLDIAPCP